MRIVSKLMDVYCANAKNDFAILDDAPNCLRSAGSEVLACVNKATYSVAKRFMEKWIENEHFELKMDVKDCK